jgi:hypothetical protein
MTERIEMRHEDEHELLVEVHRASTAETPPGTKELRSD